ncbi:transcription termination/antitermination protein NusA [candidate division WOR-1 bacterium RIFOXYC2_FULL_37_10]|uniref:Transcription termination/antitermination protein NusA n=1 Tax=candidate division WOR-1 bacterium RIFOXYB2_FULL_37_13 TaxID=1802579 RepID=A0A1F4SQQ6_UNCSA|nr:MAG: transcription termination/antitermination protein NusA [candidate division WOR-1 bacterium RIFOXYA2_FULL_37_7]OGC22677.1 MAG: transcription termination/antitermination protein NusA [candidate division WOR-1 bacterium RIFOXYB2_FULL_37_13]OGC34934.1 MAG: transcription termination/antitermination protein NusA [candidate division WOR-1 bacterium RIFOXYC2_FULL_37_10]
MLTEIKEDRRITEESLINAIKDALSSAYKKRVPEAEYLETKIDSEGEAKIFRGKVVVEEVTNKEVEISLKEAQKKQKGSKLGDIIQYEVTPEDFGRMAAQTAKQVIIQRIREAEKERVYDDYIGKVGTMVNGIVQNKETGGYLINLGYAETFLSFSESIPSENLRPKDRIKVLILEVKKTSKGPVIVVSRAHPDIVKKLFEEEIPEIKQGIIEIKAIVREAGRRTKIAIYSNDKNVGAVGTCIGPMGSRIQNITKELDTERVDIIEWSGDDSKFIANSLSPAKISKVEISKESKTARVVLPEKELSLAIGKEGQNVRLAAKLTGYRIDIVSEEGIQKQNEKDKENLLKKDEGVDDTSKED